MWSCEVEDRRAGRLAASLLCLLAMVVADSSAAQSWERGYEASGGTLPSAQGWSLVTTDPPPSDLLDETNYQVGGGLLSQGDTGGANADPGNRQWHDLVVPAFDFDDEVLELEFRLRVIDSTGTGPDDVPSGVRPNGGFDVWLVDENENAIQVAMASDFAMFRTEITGSEPFVDFDTTDSFHDYQVRVERDRTILSIDGVAQVEGSGPRIQAPGSANLVRFGDITIGESSSTQLEWIRLTRSEMPDASVRNYAVVSQTFSSNSQASLEGGVSCPAGSYALGGGVEPTGAPGSLAVVWSRPGPGAPATTWEGKAREVLPTAANWTMRVDVICGEVSGFTQYDETLSPSTIVAEKFLNLECGENEFMIGGGASIVGPELNIALHGSRLVETGPDQLWTVRARDFGAGSASTQSWTVETHAFCSDADGFEVIDVSSPMDGAPSKSVEIDCPSGTVPISGGANIAGGNSFAAIEVNRLKDGAPGEPPVGWIAEAQNTAPLWWLNASVVCAPIADPTVTKSGMVARYRGVDAGADSWGAGHATPQGGVGYAPGLTGTAFAFDGAAGRNVAIPGGITGTDHDVYFNDSFSVDAWIQSDGTTPGETNTIVSLYDWGGTNNFGGLNPAHYALTLTGDGHAAGFVRSSLEAPTLESVIGSVPLDDGEPHHLVLVRDNDALRLRLYVDGVFVGEDALVPTLSDGPLYPGYPADPDPVLIGGQYPVGSSVSEQAFEGLIDDVKFYDRALKAEEVETIAGCGLPITPRVVNLDARRYGSPANENHGLCVNLEAGDYVVTVVSPESEAAALYRGWSDAAAGGWGTAFEVDPAVDAGLTFGEAPLYASDVEAFDGLATKSFVLTLTADQRVDLSIQDALNLDNRGGISLRIEEVPEPGFAIGLLGGCALLARLRRSWRGNAPQRLRPPAGAEG